MPGPRYNFRSSAKNEDTKMSEVEGELAEKLRLLEVECQRLQTMYEQQQQQQQPIVQRDLQRPYGNLIVPKFNKSNPHLWFAQLERSFRLYKVQNDDDKFDFVTIHLEEEITTFVEDLITKPPQTNKYDALKSRLLDKFAESAESKLRRLLQGGGTAGMKPTEILSYMRRLAPDPGSEAIIHTLFIGEMPQSIRPVLSVWEEKDIEKLAKIADKMLEAVATNTSSILATHTSADNSVQAVSGTMSLSEMSAALKSLTSKVSKISSELKSLKSCRSRSNSRQRTPKASAEKNNTDGQPNLCFFHKKFGDNAKKCRPNCTRYKSSN